MTFLRNPPVVDENISRELAFKPMDDDGRLVGLSISGGGARAAAFTLGVLSELQAVGLHDGSTALERVDFISSNSGGSWAVAAYLADRASHEGSEYRLQERIDHFVVGFDSMSRGRVPCWSSAMRNGLPGQATFREIYSKDSDVRLPRAYFNAALLPSHSPFVFTDGFVRHYRIARFGACRNDWLDEVDGIADLPIAYAAAASGTVPGFYEAYASTRLCTDDATASASFCHNRPASFLRLADGGLYDNIGYKTAFEVMSSLRQSNQYHKRAMLLVNSATSIDDQSVIYSNTRDSFLVTTATNGLFASQDSTFLRMHPALFEAVGSEAPVLLDFYSASAFRAEDAVELRGLDELTYFATYNVRCFVGSELAPDTSRRLPTPVPTPELVLPDLVKKGGDCLAENFYRVGTGVKTTYRADPVLFKVMWQLGQLSVRMNRTRIVAALS